MKRTSILLVTMFLAGLFVGGVGMWYMSAQAVRARSCRSCPVCAQTQDFLLAPLSQATLPEGTTEANVADTAPKNAAEMPSQLVRQELPQDILLGHVTATQESEEKPAGVTLSDEQNTVVLSSQKPAQRATDGTSITMIEAPVTARRIQTLDQYKEFKRTARGSYPEANFSKEEVIVLESASNLPDKVFEIVSVEPQDTQLKVLYRVNVFGLDQKTNTHSAQKIDKTPKEIILEQVL